MKIHIDFSVMSETEAFGYVDGNIELSFAPRAGDYISLTGHSPSPAWPAVKGFPGRIRVASVTLWPGRDVEISLSCDDMIVSSRDEALAVAAYLEGSFGLFFNDFELK